MVLACYVSIIVVFIALIKLGLLFARMVCELNCMCRVMYFIPPSLPASSLGDTRFLPNLYHHGMFHALFPRWELAADLCVANTH